MTPARGGTGRALAAALAAAAGLGAALSSLLLPRDPSPVQVGALIALPAATAAGAAALLARRRVEATLQALAASLRTVRAEGDGPPTGGPFAALHVELEAALAAAAERQRRRILADAARDGEARDRLQRAALDDVSGQLASRLAELERAEERIRRLTIQLAARDRSLELALKNLSALNRVGVALGSELDIDRLVQLLTNISVKGLRVEVGQIMLVEERTGRLAMRAWTGLPPGIDPALAGEDGEGFSTTVAETGRPVLARHIEDGGDVLVESRYGFRRRSVLCVPIRIKERLLGTIELTNKKGDESFSEEDLALLQSIATQAGVAIENATLYRDLQASYLETIRALVQAVEEKDRYTRGHSERVTTFSEKIARRLGLPEAQVKLVQYAGVLHDVGKIGIDLAILQKRDRLTAEEYDVVKRHPLMGERIIRQVGFLKGSLAAVAQHHERYDGKGYPLGLKGEEAALESRVLAVADAYDAMITERPYRKALPKAEAVAELRRCSGTQFDPLVVETFVGILESDPEIHRLEEQLATVGA